MRGPALSFVSSMLVEVLRGATLGLGALVVACGASVTPAPSSPPDAPIAASEPRATLALVLALPDGTDCEERFDLELYRDRGVELVAWDARPGCHDRHVQIRYLPGRLSEPALRQRVGELAAPGGVKPGVATP